MSFFSKFKSTSIERELEDLYTDAQVDLFGMTPAEARQTVRDTISACKKKGREEGTDDLPPDFGDRLLHHASEGAESAVQIVGKAREEGARDEDIAEWWNLHDLQRRMVIWSEEVFRYANFKSFLDQGLHADEAMRRVRHMFPMYGDPLDTRHVQGDDRPLPDELRGRVDEYRAKHGAAKIQSASMKSTTYNAFVRMEIRGGRL